MPKSAGFETFSMDSGIKCMKASPSKDPTAKLMNIKIYFLRKFSFKESVDTPIKDIMLTTITPKKEYM